MKSVDLFKTKNKYLKKKNRVIIITCQVVVILIHFDRL